MNRRNFLLTSASGVILTAVSRPLTAQTNPSGHTMKRDLTFPKLGMKCDQRLAVELAAANGFQSVGGDTGQLTRMSPDQLNSVKELAAAKGLVWGTCGFPVDFRKDEPTFQDGLKQLPEACRAARELGIRRMTTWISPASSELTYLQNFALHTDRMKRVNAVLADHEIRLGLEYVGTQLLRFNRLYPFIHTSAEVMELIDASQGTHLGLILDSWHWWTSGESAEDLKRVPVERIVSVEINDAPPDLAREYQIDGQRRLPASTGVLPIADFLGAIAASGFDGPLMAEPFYAPLREMPPEVAAVEVAASVNRATALIP